jgi:hypothetical protein
VSGTSYPEHWRWRESEGYIRITYDNGMGLSVTRDGLGRNADHMFGEATDSRGRTWSWTAERVTLPADGRSGNCHATDAP